VAVIFGVGVAGALGAVARYVIDAAVEQRSESDFPWATFAINASGCLAVGFVIGALVDRGRAPQWLRVSLVMGFCGGYTTFSTFAQETLDLARTSALAIALVSVVANVLVGVLAVLVGTKLGQLV
jgi:CrcB protein